MRPSFRCAFAALLLLPAGAAHAYSLSGYSWPGCKPSVTFYVDVGSFPSSAGSSTDLAYALREAVDDWNGAGADVTVSYGGPSTGGTAHDGENVLSYVVGYPSTVGLIAYPYLYVSGSSFAECDGYLFSEGLDSWYVPRAIDWNVSPASDEWDVRSEFRHLIGACLGLADVSTSGEAMYGTLNAGDELSVTSDDAAGLVAIYGEDDGDSDGDGYLADEDDCDDCDGTVHPGATETCDGVDEDCDGVIDDGVGSTWYRDSDRDGYGDAGSSTTSCSAPSGYVRNDTDCADADAGVHPSAAELCDGVDQDCDGTADEGLDVTWYADTDGDGHGDPGDTASACAAPAGYVATSDDCDDKNAAVNPSVTESCDGFDDDCDGATDEGFDEDEDTFTTCAGDCNDFDAAIHPFADEICNFTDDDCDGETDEGFDGDADGFTSCIGDCDDTDPAVYPDALEICNFKDDDCDDAIDEGFDEDGDTFTTCEGDCDDVVPEVHPFADETCNGRDDDCDGDVDEGFTTTWYADADGDGFGDPSTPATGCSCPIGYVARDGDCDDDDSHVHPGEREYPNGVDADCDGDTGGGVVPTDGCGCASSPFPGAAWGVALSLVALTSLRRRAPPEDE
jgi:MYXO-CTERM domain-containing protein